MPDNLGDRMKRYESVSRNYLLRRVPVIVRVDGRAFHSFTRMYFNKGFSESFRLLMEQTMKQTGEELSGCNLAYVQSDEISFLLTDYRTVETSPFFDYNAQKLASVAASLASSAITLQSRYPCSFDGRAFNVPQDDVANYFIWRQKDATRNAIQMAAQERFSHSSLQGLDNNQLQERLFSEAGINFNDFPAYRKRGSCWLRYSGIDENIPIFTADRNYIEKHVFVRED